MPLPNRLKRLGPPRISFWLKFLSTAKAHST
ncbi:Uncharacterised protein [Vibrio cholerae]|nr:Uncharacterised protein [Vibrio cholerae]